MKFSLLWSNNEDFSRNMTRHTFRLRDFGGYVLRKGDAVHLDQVFIIFRPSSDIPMSSFAPGDNQNLTFRAETMQLMVRSDPGARHVLYSEEALPQKYDPFAPFSSDGSVGTTQRSTLYSCALSLAPDVEGSEDYWCRTYRPIRDLPMISQFQGDLSELTLELIFPLLLADSRSVVTKLPDYRILKVYAELSVRCT
jgi:hypothetical protein